MIGKLLDRYMWVVDLVIIAVFATFLAAGVDHFLTGLIDDAIQGAIAPSQDSSVSGKVHRAPTTPSFTPVDGLAILRRNLFDSETGPLDGVVDLTEQFSEEAFVEYSPEQMEGMIPPRCNTPITVQACYASLDHPDYSFAAVQQDNESKILHMGDTVGNLQVQEITWRYVFMQQQGGALCYLDIWNEPMQAPVIAAQTTAVNPTTPAQKMALAKGGPGSAADFQALLNKSIADVSPTEKDIDRTLIDYLVQNKQMLMQSGRVLPNVEGDEINGFKVYGIRKTSLWGKLGIHNGDVVLTVNDMQMDGPDKAYDAFAGLSGSDSMDVQILRHGKPMSFTYNIK